MVPFLNFHLWSQIQLLSFPHYFVVLLVLWLSRVWLFVTPWTTANQVPLSTVSQNLLKFTSIELVMPSNHLILYFLVANSDDVAALRHKCFILDIGGKLNAIYIWKKKTESYFTFSTKYFLWSNILRKPWGRRERDRQRQRDSFFNRRLLSPNLPVWHTQSFLNDIVLKHLST